MANQNTLSLQPQNRLTLSAKGLVCCYSPAGKHCPLHIGWQFCIPYLMCHSGTISGHVSPAGSSARRPTSSGRRGRGGSCSGEPHLPCASSVRPACDHKHRDGSGLLAGKQQSRHPCWWQSLPGRLPVLTTDSTASSHALLHLAIQYSCTMHCARSMRCPCHISPAPDAVWQLVQCAQSHHVTSAWCVTHRVATLLGNIASPMLNATLLQEAMLHCDLVH